MRQAGEIAFMDEFGSWEAEGGGHFGAWVEVQQQEPRACILGVRKGRLADMERVLGRSFDLVVEAGEANAESKLLDALSDLRDWERVGLYGAGAGSMEASLGAALHTFKVPITGLVMASLQVVVMSMAAEKLQRRERVVWVSTIAAGLKALSPSGSRLGPMLAITVQGILATAVFRLLGWNRWGAFWAGAVACAWAGLQGLFIQYLLLGNGLVRAYDAMAQWIGRRLHVEAPAMITLILALAVSYAGVGGLITMWVWKMRNRPASGLLHLSGLDARLSQASNLAVLSYPNASFARQAASLIRPSFLLPLVIVGVILFAAGHPAADIGWMALRAFAVGLALIGALRWLDPAGFLAFLRRKGKWGPAYAIARVFKHHP
jgi:hypothetical protein